jgi:hypothetical protein
VPVLVSLPRRAPDGVAHLARLARILGVGRDPAVVDLVKRGYNLYQEAPPGPEVAAFAPIWMDPLMTINGDTFGSDVLARAGARNVFGDRLRLYPLAADLGKAEPIDAGGRDVRYPRIRAEEVRERGPSVIVLTDEPHDFTSVDTEALAAMAPGAKLVRISGKDLFWYGAWQIDALSRIRDALAPHR